MAGVHWDLAVLAFYAVLNLHLVDPLGFASRPGTLLRLLEGVGRVLLAQQAADHHLPGFVEGGAQVPQLLEDLPEYSQRVLLGEALDDEVLVEDREERHGDVLAGTLELFQVVQDALLVAGKFVLF